ncbi:MAG: DTW domain-containing protein [Deltaproteobacteria bacterium]|nr:MAG: DTW domain-containing protein [Deltaproteobacteria bacterium]
MGARKYGRPRCEGCGLWPRLCMCSEIPRVETQTRWVLVQRHVERFKPTNTGKLVLRAFSPSERVFFGGRDDRIDPSIFTGHGPAYVLYPSDDAIVAAPGSLDGPPRTVVVLDATWHQGSRMRRRVPGVADLPAVTLPPGPPSIWPARTQHDPRGLSTFEACARLLACIEGPGNAEPLERFFAAYCERLRAMRDGRERP